MGRLIAFSIALLVASSALAQFDSWPTEVNVPRWSRITNEFDDPSSFTVSASIDATVEWQQREIGAAGGSLATTVTDDGATVLRFTPKAGDNQGWNLHRQGTTHVCRNFNRVRIEWRVALDDADDVDLFVGMISAALKDALSADGTLIETEHWGFHVERSDGTGIAKPTYNMNGANTVPTNSSPALPDYVAGDASTFTTLGIEVTNERQLRFTVNGQQVASVVSATGCSIFEKTPHVGFVGNGNASDGLWVDYFVQITERYDQRASALSGQSSEWGAMEWGTDVWGG